MNGNTHFKGMFHSGWRMALEEGVVLVNTKVEAGHEQVIRGNGEETRMSQYSQTLHFVLVQAKLKKLNGIFLTVRNNIIKHIAHTAWHLTNSQLGKIYYSYLCGKTNKKW
jgi:hypothetical protein